MTKKNLLVSAFAIFFLPQTLFAQDSNANKSNHYIRTICISDAHKTSFILKFKETPEPKVLETMLDKLKLPGYRFSNLVLIADRTYSFNFQLIRHAGQLLQCFDKELLDELKLHIQQRLPELETVKLNKSVSYIEFSEQKGHSNFSIPF